MFGQLCVCDLDPLEELALPLPVVVAVFEVCAAAMVYDKKALIASSDATTTINRFLLLRWN